MKWKYKVGDIVKIKRFNSAVIPKTNYWVGDVVEIDKLIICDAYPAYRVVGDKEYWFWFEFELEFVGEEASFDGLEELL